MSWRLRLHHAIVYSNKTVFRGSFCRINIILRALAKHRFFVLKKPFSRHRWSGFLVPSAVVISKNLHFTNNSVKIKLKKEYHKIVKQWPFQNIILWKLFFFFFFFLRKIKTNVVRRFVLARNLITGVLLLFSANIFTNDSLFSCDLKFLSSFILLHVKRNLKVSLNKGVWLGSCERYVGK